jgi:hypothetical protein
MPKEPLGAPSTALPLTERVMGCGTDVVGDEYASLPTIGAPEASVAVTLNVSVAGVPTKTLFVDSEPQVVHVSVRPWTAPPRPMDTVFAIPNWMSFVMLPVESTFPVAFAAS